VSKPIAIEPKSFPEYEAAVIAGGGHLVKLAADVKAVIWTDYTKPAELAAMLDANPQIEWVQLPFAGVDAFSDIISRPIQFTSAKGAYREPVAEHALALTLALLRILPERARSMSWGRRFAQTLYGANVVIVGGGGIAEELIKLAAPFNSQITVVRKSSQKLAGAAETVGFEKFDAVLPAADVVILAAALTEETKSLFNAKRFALLKPTAVLVNVARGPLVVTADLIEALNENRIAGAALDVTDPEPLPDGHDLWSAKNILITPHTADTREMVVRLFSERITANVAAYCAGGPWVGAVDSALGY
jgi:phosphoglycerate dehydrogenase-like enzyme